MAILCFAVRAILAVETLIGWKINSRVIEGMLLTLVASRLVHVRAEEEGIGCENDGREGKGKTAKRKVISFREDCGICMHTRGTDLIRSNIADPHEVILRELTVNRNKFCDRNTK